jgi:hypothetical protein
VGPQRQIAGTFSSDTADDGWRARLDGTAGPRRHGTAAAVPRVNVPSAGTSPPTLVTRSAPPAFSAAGPLPTTVLRSPEPGIAPSGRGLQARINAQPGFAASRTVTPGMMPPGLPRLPLPRTAAHSTAGGEAVSRGEIYEVKAIRALLGPRVSKSVARIKDPIGQIVVIGARG